MQPNMQPNNVRRDYIEPFPRPLYPQQPTPPATPPAMHMQNPGYPTVINGGSVNGGPPAVNGVVKARSIQTGSEAIVAGKDQPPVADTHLPYHNKTDKFNIFSTARPHMRAFHYSWLTSAISFYAWFAISPLLSSVMKPRCESPMSELCTMTCIPSLGRNVTFLGRDPECRVCFPRDRDYGCGGLGLTQDQVFSSNAIGVAGTLGLRLFGGPIIDKIGAKWFNLAIMVFSIWSLYWLAFAETYEELVAARFFVSFLGATFVGTSAWCSLHFDKSIVGLVGATASGWGKVGAGIAYLTIPLIYRSLKDDYDNEYAWRRTLIIPPSLMVLVIICTFFFSDNSPDDEKFISEKKKDEKRAIKNHDKKSAALHIAFGAAASNYRTWVMGLLFFASNGVDICMGSVVGYYFVNEFNMTQSAAALAGSSFGLMNLFARSLGGLLSDKLYIRLGLFGRVIATFLCTMGMGIGLVVFTSITETRGGLTLAILVLMIASIFTQAAQGACYGIVPTIDPRYVGAVSGIVGAGGNLGAICMNLLMAIGFRQAWQIIGYGCIFVGFTVFFVATPDAKSRQIIADSLRKNARGLIRSHTHSSEEGSEALKALPALVMILAKKEEELSMKDRLIDGLQRRLGMAPSSGSNGVPHQYQVLPSSSNPGSMMQPRRL
mmetsp:Transcript_17878/g.34944  ORF Transcript_17878/g.34944 Transcript_17878/m.34944 type:complete len:660 (+) Transcript_17878:203-2182(+)